MTVLAIKAISAAVGLTSLLLATSTACAQNYLPDPERAPGIVDSSMTVDDLCPLRHPHPNLSHVKKRLMRESGFNDPAQFQLDHRVPLCAGGHRKDERNLWLQPRSGQWGAKFKDQLETSVCRQLCLRGITLEAAQAIFLAPDWRVEYERFFSQGAE